MKKKKVIKPEEIKQLMNATSDDDIEDITEEIGDL